MALKQFDVFENPSPEARRFAPYLVVLSSHLVLGFDDAVVAPLVNDSQATVGALEIEVDFAGERLVLVVSELAGMAGRNLRTRAGSLLTHEDDVARWTGCSPALTGPPTAICRRATRLGCHENP